MKRTGALWFAALLISSCAPRATTRDPFRIPRAELLGAIQVVAIAPFQFPPDLEAPEATQAIFEPLIELELRGAPFRVISASESQPILDRILSEAGPWVDVKAHRLDVAKREQIWEKYDEEVRRKHGVEYVLYPDIHVVRAELKQDVATWDGTSVALTSGFRRTFLSTRSGTIGAVSLGIRLRRTDGSVVYSNVGGIDLIGSYEGAKPLRKPQPEWFKDEGRNRAAVHLAVGPLVSREDGKDDPAGDPMK